MISARDVIYDYPAARALNGVSFTVAKGAVLALVGPNGAGKSTLMRCIAALDRPTAGTISVAGLDTLAEPRGVHAALGYLPDFFGLYDELSVRRSLVYAARSRGVAEDAAEDAALKAAARVELSDRLERRAGELSRGLRQRLAIAQTIVHTPSVLLLDEPAAGLDPDARRSLSDLIRKLAGEGMTVLVSSHILAELEDYCTEMLMLRDGRAVGGGVVRAGSRSSTADGPARIGVAFAQAYDDLGGRLAALGLIVESAGPDEAVLVLEPGAEAQSQTLATLVGAGLAVRGFAPLRVTLEDAYLKESRKPSQGDRP
ncbi:MAG TPA: ABC transporter ATP-binding protein [Caulobacteraceae bacterium]|jgi:ABC-2 type transport system ATP-binding protein|nr:ABC transporter ATP-binding protein [Caulobacteraceae bacterium]